MLDLLTVCVIIHACQDPLGVQKIRTCKEGDRSPQCNYIDWPINNTNLYWTLILLMALSIRFSYNLRQCLLCMLNHNCRRGWLVCLQSLIKRLIQYDIK
jgi:hypothetical protein